MKEPFSKQLEPKFKFFAGIILTIFGVLLIRLWVLQIMDGASSMSKSRANQTRVVRVNAPRGFFYDRQGEILVSTRISRNVSVVPEDIKDKPQVLELLTKILQTTPADIEAKLQPNLKNPRRPYQYVTIQKDIDPATAIKILEAKLDLPGVEVDEVPLRFYKYGEFASHLFGYIREINDAELNRLRSDGYKLGDLIGKTGLERTYESYLRGNDGGKIYEVDISGRRKAKLETQEAKPGNNLHLTLDYKLQAAAERALEEQLTYLQQHTKYKNAKSGAVIALDPRNGDILAMTSKPGYDPNLFVGSIPANVANDLYNNPLFPLMNRVLQGEFAPGSTFKPVTVLTALKENKVTADERFYCNGYDPVWKSKFRCWTVSSGSSPHGEETIIDGLRNSCNIVMGELSRRTGIEALAASAKAMGFGKKTGLNLYPGEKIGLVPDPDWKRKNTRDKNWMPLETLHFGIGQGYLTVTPLQLAQFYGALANHGIAYRPRVVTRISDIAGEVVKEFRPSKAADLNVSQEYLEIVKKGLEEVVGEGTAAHYFRGFPLDKYPVAGKTGTAEKPPYDNNGVFASFAPANNPEIVVVVVVEQGGSGSAGATPIARKVLEAYFNILPPETRRTPKGSTTAELLQTPVATPALEGPSPQEAGAPESIGDSSFLGE